MGFANVSHFEDLEKWSGQYSIPTLRPLYTISIFLTRTSISQVDFCLPTDFPFYAFFHT